jgi:hypothetical protein
VETNDVRKDVSDCILRSFLYAGSSALVISVAHLHPELWFISLIALIPFLYRVARAGIFESVVLGAILATSYCFVTVGIVAWVAPATFLHKLFGLNVLFILYGIAVNRVVKHIGFNAVFISVFWLPLEYGLSHYDHLGSILTFPEADSTLLMRVGSLFGLLIVSFLVVLINSLILILSEHIAGTLCSGTSMSFEDDEGRCEIYWEVELERRLCFFIDTRAPPKSFINCNILKS